MQRVFLFLLLVLRVLTKISPSTSSVPAQGQRAATPQPLANSVSRTMPDPEGTGLKPNP